MSNLNVKELNPATTIITGSAGTGKTILMKKMILEQCANGTQCIVFSLFGEYKKECKSLGGICIPVTEKSSISRLPDSNCVVYEFEYLYDGRLQSNFMRLLNQVYEIIKTDTSKKKDIVLDISPMATGLFDEMSKNIGKYNAALTIAYQK